MKKIFITLLTFVAFIGSANTDSLTDTDKAAQKALAEQYVQALQNKDMNTVNQLIDYDEFFERLNSQLSQVSVNEKIQKKSKARFIKWQKRHHKLYANSACITLIGWRKLPNFSGYLIRIIDKNYSPIYMSLVVEKTNKQWKIVDFYDATRQDISSHYTSIAFQQMILGNNNIFKRLKKNDYVSFMDKLTSFNKQVEAKQFSKAIKTYRSFSDKLKKEESIIDIGLVISRYYFDEQFYNELLTVIRKYHQNNSKYYAMLSDYFVIKKDYDKAREIVKNFFSAISDNAMMNLILSSISLAEEDYSRALKEAKKCAEAESNLQPCYDMWVGIAEIMKNYDEEVLAYQTMSKNMGYDLSKSMFNEKDNGDFMRSDAFKNWDIPEKSK